MQGCVCSRICLSAFLFVCLYMIDFSRMQHRGWWGISAIYILCDCVCFSYCSQRYIVCLINSLLGSHTYSVRALFFGRRVCLPSLCMLSVYLEKVASRMHQNAPFSTPRSPWSGPSTFLSTFMLMSGVSSPSVVWSGAPAEIDFLHFNLKIWRLGAAVYGL